MFVLPELAVLDIAEVALAQLTGRPAILNAIMAGRPEPELQSLRTALLKRPGKARLGFALEAPEDWQVSIHMVGTADPKHLLGDDFGPTEVVDGFETALAAEVPADTVGPLALMDDLPDDLPERGRLAIGGEVATYQVESGAVVLKRRGLERTADVAHEIGTPVIFQSLQQLVGWPEIVTMRLDAISTNSMLNVVLGAAIKGALLLNRGLFHDAGMTLMTVGESDIQPRLMFLPAPMLSRTLTVQLRRDMALPEEVPVLTDFGMDLTVEGVEADGAAQG